jgi:hypothetical protein
LDLSPGAAGQVNAPQAWSRPGRTIKSLATTGGERLHALWLHPQMGGLSRRLGDCLRRRDVRDVGRRRQGGMTEDCWKTGKDVPLST